MPYIFFLRRATSQHTLNFVFLDLKKEYVVTCLKPLRSEEVDRKKYKNLMCCLMMGVRVVSA